MSKFIYHIFILFLFISGLTYSQWINTYNGQGNSDDRGHGIVVDSYGNNYTVGYTTGETTGIDIIVVKRTAYGEPVWSSIYNGSGNNTDRAHGIVVDNSGNVYITGYTTRQNGNIDYLTVKYNSNGIQQWYKTFNGTGNQEDRSWGLVVDESGNCFVTGTSKSSSNGTDIVTIKYSSSGTEVWNKSYDAPAHKNDEGRKIAIDSQNNLYVVGFGEYSSGHQDYLLIKYSHGGSFQWVKNYNGFQGGFDRSWGIVIDNEDYIYITGESEGDNDKFDFVTIKYNSSGTLKWLHRFTDSDQNDKPYGIVVDNLSGSVIVTGTSETANRGLDFLTLRISIATGELIWSKFFNGPGNQDDIPYDIVMAHNETNPYFMIAGSTKMGTSPNEQDICMISYRITGQLFYQSIFNISEGLEDGAFGITVDQNDNYFLAGYVGVITESSSSAVSYDMLTLKHESINPIGIITPLVNVPGNYYLSQNYPNPFNPETIISFGIPENSNVNVSVYDITGKFVQNLVNSNLSRGSYNVSFNGNSLSSGIYIYRITAGRFTETKTMILVK